MEFARRRFHINDWTKERETSPLEGFVSWLPNNLPKQASTCVKQQRSNMMRIEKWTRTSTDWFKGKSAGSNRKYLHLYLMCSLQDRPVFVDVPWTSPRLWITTRALWCFNQWWTGGRATFGLMLFDYLWSGSWSQELPMFFFFKSLVS